MRLVSSPVAGFSILTTSAPISARTCVQSGPAMMREKSTTLVPRSGGEPDCGTGIWYPFMFREIRGGRPAGFRRLCASAEFVVVAVQIAGNAVQRGFQLLSGARETKAEILLVARAEGEARRGADILLRQQPLREIHA